MSSKTGGTKKKHVFKDNIYYFLSLKYSYKKILIKKLSNRDK
jgi:hypothetical protein